MLDKSNTAKAAITQKYLGLDNLGDADNPLVYSVSQTVNMLPIFAYQKIYFDFFRILNGKSIWLILIMLIIGQVLAILHYIPICLRCAMPIIRKIILWVCCLLLSMVQ